MSYDIYLRGDKHACDSCGRAFEEPDLPNPTYNLTPIFDFALTGEALPNPEVTEGAVVLLRKPTSRPRGLRVLNGMKADVSIHVIDDALARLGDPALRGKFQALEPSNGWGDLCGATRVMNDLRRAAGEFPDHTWEIH